MATKKKPAKKAPPEPEKEPPAEPKQPEETGRASVVVTDPRTPYPTRDNPNPQPAP